MGNTTSKAQRQQFLDLWNIIKCANNNNINLKGTDAVSSVPDYVELVKGILEPVLSPVYLGNVFNYEVAQSETDLDSASVTLLLRGDIFSWTAEFGFAIRLLAMEDSKKNAKTICVLPMCSLYKEKGVIKSLVDADDINDAIIAGAVEATTLAGVVRVIQRAIARNRELLKAQAEVILSGLSYQREQASLLVDTINTLPIK